MILQVSHDEGIRTYEEPDADRIRNAIRSLSIDEFAILERGDQRYVQTYHEDDGTYALEYRAGSADKHYAVEGNVTDVEAVVAAFLGYHAGDESWNEPHEWEKLDFDDEE